MKYTALIAIMVAALVAAGAFIVITNDSDGKRDCDIAVTMGWQKEMVDTISQGGLDVAVLMTENTSPHAMYSTTSSIEYLHNADLFFEIGSGVEWEESMISNVKDAISTPTVSCMDMMPSEHEHEHSHDHEEGHGHNHESHIWVDPENLESISKGIADVLREKFPQVADKIDDGLNDYLNRLSKITDSIEDLVMNKAPDQTIFVWHNAWDPLMEYVNSTAEHLTGTHYCEHHPFMNIESGESAGAGDSPTVSTIEYMNNHLVNKTIYVSPFDTASQYKSIFEQNGFNVIGINPTAWDFLENLGAFIDHLNDTLNDKE